MQSSRRDHDGALRYLRRTVLSKAQMLDKGTVDALTHSRIVDGFASSAHWGSNGECNSSELDDTVPTRCSRFDVEVTNKLVPREEIKTSLVRPVDYTTCCMNHHLTLANSRQGVLNAYQLGKNLKPSTTSCSALGERATKGSGDVNIEADSRSGGGNSNKSYLRAGKTYPFDTRTSYLSMPGKFDDNVKQIARDSAKRDDYYVHEQAKLKSLPFTSREPNAYLPTSSDYINMSTIDPFHYRAAECVTHNSEYSDGTSHENEVQPRLIYRSRYNNVHRGGPHRRARTYSLMQQQHNIDTDALRATQRRMHAAAFPANYKPASTKNWSSTTHREYTWCDAGEAHEVNKPDATVPFQSSHRSLVPDMRSHDQKQLEQASHCTPAQLTPQRSCGSNYTRKLVVDKDYAYVDGTEYRDNYMDRFADADTCKNFSKRSAFDIRDGVYTMHHIYLNPCNNNTVCKLYAPAEIVPGQYTTMSQKPLHAADTVCGFATRQQ